MRQVSAHAKTMMALLNNAMQLCCVHNEYRMSRDVILAAQKIGKSLGFELDSNVYQYILSNIGTKHAHVMAQEFAKFARLISIIDRKLDKENIANDRRNI